MNNMYLQNLNLDSVTGAVSKVTPLSISFFKWVCGGFMHPFRETWMPEFDVGSFTLSFVRLLFETGSLNWTWNSRIHLEGLARKPQGCDCLYSHPPLWRLQMNATLFSLYEDGRHSGHHTCMASIYPTSHCSSLSFQLSFAVRFGK